MNSFHIQFFIDEDAMADVLAFIRGKVSKLKVRNSEDPEEGTQAAPKRTINKASPVRDAAVEFVRSQEKDTVLTLDQVSAPIVKAGGSAHSASPIMTFLTRKGLVKRLGNKTWQVTGKKWFHKDKAVAA